MKEWAWQDWTHSQRHRGAGLTRLGLLLPKTAREGRQEGGGVSPPYRCAQRRKQGEEGVGLTGLDPLAAHHGGRPDKTGPATAKNCTGGKTGGGGIPTVPVRPAQNSGRGRSWPDKTGPTRSASGGQA